MRLPAKYGDGLLRLPFGTTEASATEAFKEGMTGRLYFRFPHLRPGAVDAVVQEINWDSAVFRLTGPCIAPPPIDTIPKERLVPLAGLWLWSWDASDANPSAQLRSSSTGGCPGAS
jgi:hypothetical protein